MLHLIQRNKAGRNFNNEPNTNWKNLFKTSEDSFTSSIFGLLFYLPIHLLWPILKDAMSSSTDLPNPTRLNYYHFWPSWTCKLGNRCEPDIFVSFDEFDLIIEAKRYDRNQQSKLQWINEIESYQIEFGLGKPVFLLAIGGVFDNDQKTSLEEVNDIKVEILKCKWARLLQSISVRHKALLRSRTVIEDPYINIFNDLILSFRIHGFQTGLLFDTMPKSYNINLNGAEIKLKLITTVSLKSIPINYKILNFSEIIKQL